MQLKAAEIDLNFQSLIDSEGNPGNDSNSPAVTGEYLCSAAR